MVYPPQPADLTFATGEVANGANAGVAPPGCTTTPSRASVASHRRSRDRSCYTAQVLDRVRMDEANRIALPDRHHQSLRVENLRRVLTGKGARWLLLRDRGNLRSPAERVRLEELLAANRSLFILYVLKRRSAQLWRLRDPAIARRWWESWYVRACESGIAAVVRFANRLGLAADYIINHARYPLHTSLLEGINNRIKVMKRIAYGYRDEDYFFLKIRAAFPGIT